MNDTADQSILYLEPAGLGKGHKESEHDSHSNVNSTGMFVGDVKEWEKVEGFTDYLWIAHTGQAFVVVDLSGKQILYAASFRQARCLICDLLVK